ncbi:hypothetical protein BC939DRAFT_454660 [Gamsiella multidivaricata]|uniref:uncharacterized protein n=1 Tax=Gamsiella multidivaricata TaxID=101098 RepID=UPI00221FDA2C|nr:uncharacterized protein BC939DRAFT_454660 [Gamsiella multidivaricata]KAI7821851.1 hypothetical protein BC939DRAFT_454660 [Gamsiella multidivaricata]
MYIPAIVLLYSVSSIEFYFLAPVFPGPDPAPPILTPALSREFLLWTTSVFICSGLRVQHLVIILFFVLTFNSILPQLLLFLHLIPFIRPSAVCSFVRSSVRSSLRRPL